MKVWIMNHYATSMFFDKGGRHYWFAKYLKKRGYDPIVFCSSNKYNSGEDVNLENGKYKVMYTDDGVPFVFVKTPHYEGNGLSRIKSMYSFYRNLFPVCKAIGHSNGRPDIIYASSVHPLTLVAGIKISKRLKIPCICEVRDLWPASLVAFGFLKGKSVITKLLYKGERWIYKKADRLIFTMEGGADYVTDRGWDKVVALDKIFYINNGLDLEEFEENSEKYIIDDDVLDRDDTMCVLFTGSFGSGQNLNVLLDTAKNFMAPEWNHIRFVLYGAGIEKEALLERQKREGITNVVFRDPVEKKYIPSLVRRADINLMSLSYGEEHSGLIDQYGQSQNKLFEYLASGKPVIQTIDPGYNILTKYDCGISTKKQSADEISSAIKLLVTDVPLCEKYSRNAFIAVKDFDMERLTGKVVAVIESAMSGRE